MRSRANGIRSFFSRNVSTPPTFSLRSSRNPPSTSRSSFWMRIRPCGSIRATGQIFSLTKAGSDSRVRTRSSKCSSGSRFSISRLRSTGYAHWVRREIQLPGDIHENLQPAVLMGTVTLMWQGACGGRGGGIRVIEHGLGRWSGFSGCRHDRVTYWGSSPVVVGGEHSRGS